MSKKALKTALSHLDADGLRQLVIDLYETRPEAKAFLDFFVNPDVKALTGKYLKAIAKELRRASRGRGKPRITNVRKLLSDYRSYSPGDEEIAALLVETMRLTVQANNDNRFADSVQKSFSRLMNQAVAFCAAHGFMNEVGTLGEIAEQVAGYRNRDFRTMLREAISDALAPE